MAKPAIQIEGVRELSRALTELDKTIAKELRAEFKTIADKVADDARTKVPLRTGKASGSIRSGASAQSAFVRAGKDVPYYKWLDFGSRDPVSGQPRSVGPWKGSGQGPKGGRFLYPAIDEHRDDIERAALEAIDDAARKAGLREV